jgi:hypothetical protein
MLFKFILVGKVALKEPDSSLENSRNCGISLTRFIIVPLILAKLIFTEFTYCSNKYCNFIVLTPFKLFNPFSKIPVFKEFPNNE